MTEQKNVLDVNFSQTCLKGGQNSASALDPEKPSWQETEGKGSVHPFITYVNIQYLLYFGRNALMLR